MAWGQDFLKGFFGNDTLRDYTHASKTFRRNGYELSPRPKFLYHVNFGINMSIPGIAQIFGVNDLASLSLVVKTATLPSYNIDVNEFNQYNRKRFVQTKISYQPVTITFHDDTGDLVRNMWYNYYRYYYKDPSQNYRNLAAINGSIGDTNTDSNGFDYNSRDIYSPNRQVNDWGFIGEGYYDGPASFVNADQTSGKPAFFRDIIITGFSQHKYAQYVLINPIITNWTHDTYDYTQGTGVMSNTMTIKYETVKYLSGALGGIRRGGDTNVFGFANDATYDTRLSPIARPGANATVLGQGGLLDTGIGIIEDLQAVASGRGGLQQILGAAQAAGTAYQTFKGKNLRAVANEEARQVAKDIIRQDLPNATRSIINKGNGVFFPNAPKLPTNTTTSNINPNTLQR